MNSIIPKHHVMRGQELSQKATTSTQLLEPLFEAGLAGPSEG
jgi:hypothetical protein